MQNYKTVEEKANECNVSPRHIQNLCRNGKVEGAIKRVGVWFIPKETPIPLKNTKADTAHFNFIGTKSRLFDSAIELFADKGFEGISIKDIANSVGIRQSALYNHFKSKQEILDTIYDFYCYYYLANRSSIEDVEPILQEGALIDIICCVRYEFDIEHNQRMLSITKLILNRCTIDERAREIMRSLMIEEGVQYVEAVFNKAVEIGRLAPLDTHAMAIFINSTSLFRLRSWVLDSSAESAMKRAEEELKQYEYATKLLIDLKSKSINTIESELAKVVNV